MIAPANTWKVVAPNDAEIAKLFLQLKSISLKLATFLRLTSLLSRAPEVRTYRL